MFSFCCFRYLVVDRLPELFTGKQDASAAGQDQLIGELYKQIGQLMVERDWLKKKADMLS